MKKKRDLTAAYALRDLAIKESKQVWTEVDIDLSLVDMPRNAAKLASKLTAAKIRELIAALEDELGE